MDKVSEKHPHINITWQSLLDASEVGLFVLDRDERVVWANSFARRVRLDTCLDPDIAVGNNFSDLLPPDRREPVKQVLSEIFGGEKKSYEVCYNQGTANEIWIDAHYSPIIEENGEINYICITVADISERKRKEQELKRLERRWKFALEGAGNGVWEYNFQTGDIFYSSFYKQMLGYTDQNFDNQTSEWLRRIHPEDRHRVADIDRQYLEDKITTHSVEYRLQHKSGNFIWVLDKGMLLERDENGAPLKLIGTNKDITARREAEEQLLKSEQRFSSFMDNSPSLTWIMDEKHVFHYMNRPYMEAFNLTEDAIGKSMYDIFPKEICDGFALNNALVWHRDATLETIEEGRGPDGEQQFYQIFKFPLPGEPGNRLMGGVALDITGKLHAEKQLADERERNKQKLIQGIIDAQEKERDELAYELHENVNQILSSAKMMLEVASSDPGMAQDFVKRSLPHISDAINELRKISQGLRPSTLRDISLEAAISEVVFAVNSKRRTEVRSFQKGISNIKNLHPDLKLVVLRTVQELLNNISRHSEAKQAELNLEVDAEKLLLTIRDDGKGFDPATLNKGVGLNNIINRIEFHRGTVRIEATPGQGSRIHIVLPLLSAS
jgi:PAS domain S-box-containing protein